MQHGNLSLLISYDLNYSSNLPTNDFGPFAPQTVILKKHVNKNSVVYMEPSKDNKFHNVKNDCGIIHFSPEMSSPCMEKLTIPRAKLSMGNDWTPC